MKPNPWTRESLRGAIGFHLSQWSEAEERAGEIEEEIKRLKAELAQLEAVSWRHRKAQYRLEALKGMLNLHRKGDAPGREGRLLAAVTAAEQAIARAEGR